MEHDKEPDMLNRMIWLLILFSGAVTFFCALANLLVQMAFLNPRMSATLYHMPEAASPAAVFMFAHFRGFLAILLLACVLVLVSAACLLKRHNWARYSIAGVLSLAIVWNVIWIGIQVVRLSSPELLMSRYDADIQAFAIVMPIVTTLFAVGLSIFFGWLIRYLLSAEVAAEFRRR